MIRSKASTSWVLALLTVLATAAAACFEIGGFECGSDEACTRDETAGRCEAEGVCAYPSEACPSRWRYSPNAGSLADTCVPEGDGGDTDPGTSSGGPGTSSITGDPALPMCPGCQPLVIADKTFFVCAATSTWFDARDACSDCGLELASIRSDAENQALAERVPATV